MSNSDKSDSSSEYNTEDEYDLEEKDTNNWLVHAGYTYEDFITFLKTYLKEDFLVDNPLTVLDLDLSCAPPDDYPDHDGPELIHIQCPKDVRNYLIPFPLASDSEEYCFVSANMGGGHDNYLQILFRQEGTELDVDIEEYARTMTTTKKARLA
jgi:hypothetical protein